MTTLAPPVQVVASGAPPFVQVASGAPPFVAVSGNAPPITIVASGAPPITLFNEDGSLWSAHTPAGGEVLLTGETDGFATDFLHPVDAERVAVKTAGTVVSSGTSFFTNGGVSSKWVYNAAGTLVNIPVGTLALDYDPVTHVAKGLLVEPAGTNNTTRSSEFDAAVWNKNDCTVSANAITAPNGSLEADAIIPNNGLMSSFTNSSTPVANGVSNTFSVYAKNGTLGTNWFRIATTATPTYEGYFNLATGVKGGTTGAGAASTITTLPNGWYRVTLTFTAGAATTNTYLATAVGDGNAGAITGNGTSPAFYLWGAQAETGTIATSPIPTTSATVTRAADNVSITPASINYSATAGSWWVDLEVLPNSVPGGIIGQSGANVPAMYVQTTAQIALFDTSLLSTIVGSTLGLHKFMSAYQASSRAITGDGLAPATDAGATTGLLSPATILFGISNSVGINGYIRKVRYLPRRPSNAELVTMTT